MSAPVLAFELCGRRCSTQTTQGRVLQANAQTLCLSMPNMPRAMDGQVVGFPQEEQRNFETGGPWLLDPERPGATHSEEAPIKPYAVVNFQALSQKKQQPTGPPVAREMPEPAGLEELYRARRFVAGSDRGPPVRMPRAWGGGVLAATSGEPVVPGQAGWGKERTCPGVEGGEASGEVLWKDGQGGHGRQGEGEGGGWSERK